jgi:NAD(P)-dependent dehydrogenase (short-subunit alcohol dehydrogenase family)
MMPVKTLTNRCALITGASEGFGAAVARAFVTQGAHVLLCARGRERLEQTRREIAAAAAAGSRIEAVQADVSSPADVERLVAAALEKLGGLDIVVANAGVYGPKGPVETLDWTAWCQAVAINLHGTVLTCRAALPYLKQHHSGKIIILSGGGATRPMPFLSAYAVSKAAVVRFAETLAGEVADFGIDVNSIAPGALNTRLLDEILEAGPEKVGPAFHAEALRQRATGGDSLERAAALCVFLASSSSDGITGKLLSARWDPWAELGCHREDLQRSDIYTLRRIVPGDRGKDWGAVA